METVIALAAFGISGVTALVAISLWIRGAIFRRKRKKRRRRLG
jgi:hypothetical protein